MEMYGKGKDYAASASNVGLKRQWVPSNVTVGTIEELRAAGYIPALAMCRAPMEGETSHSSSAIATPKKGERVVSIPHLVQDLGFPLNPLVRGLLFYYGLDFHHLGPNSILHIATFITICEAFLRVKPHFSLWLKMFSVMPKSSGPQLAECGGAKIRKLPNVIWPKGTFVETIKLLQQEWFYITNLRTKGQKETPVFSASLQEGLFPGQRRALIGGTRTW